MSPQRNVGQQNDAVRDAILRIARHYLEQPATHAWLAPCLRQHGLDPAAGPLVDVAYHIDQYGDDAHATWLTDDGRFWRAEVFVPRDGSNVELEAFDEITGTTPTSAHLRGTGKSFGALALEVQSELRRQPDA